MYFLLFPEWIGYGYYFGDQWVFKRLVGGFLIDFLPLISILMITRIFLNVFLVRNEYYTRKLRLFEILQAIAVIALSVLILSHGTDLVFEDTTSGTSEIATMFSRVIRVIIYVTIGSSVLNIGKQGYAIYKNALGISK
jgi:hypothetical protein